MTNFDRIIDRYHTNSVKYDFAVARGYPADVLPLFVADMDFPAPQPVLDALHRVVDHGIFGYSDAMPDYYEAVAGWFSRRFGWETKPEWLVKSPGIVTALAIAVRALTEPGDGVLVQPPVYGPFFSMTRKNGRRVVECPLVERDGRYSIDFEAFERAVTEERVRLFLLCSPHNPTGRVWTAAELQKMGDICRKHDVCVVSDEIHCDFAFPEHPHHTFLAAVPDMADRTVVCTAPSKTFNIAGLQASNLWIPDAALRRRFCEEMERSGIESLNTVALTAARVAYEQGGPWLDECRAYLRGNLDFLRQFLAARLPQLRLLEPEGTYFAWLDCAALGLTPDGLNELMGQKAHVRLQDGRFFGAAYGQYQRVVLACPRALLRQALERIEAAVQAHLRAQER